MIRVAAVRFGPVQRQISLNPKPNFGSGSQNFMNLNLMLRELDFRFSSGSSRSEPELDLKVCSNASRFPQHCRREPLRHPTNWQSQRDVDVMDMM